MISCRVENATRHRVSSKQICGIIQEVARRSKTRKQGLVFVHIVGTRRSQTLNKKFHKEDGATDVLSFEAPSTFFEPVRWIGQIILCPSIIEKQARARGESFRNELAHVTVHGAFHIFGQHHEKSKKAAARLRAEEDRILEKLGYKPMHTKTAS